jgi:3'(2'), 5'-bisphosphate nucleotidase
VDENSLEVLTAVRAVRMASELCRRVRRDLVVAESLLKSDRSPVTIADFGSQAILCKNSGEPKDVIVAEKIQRDPEATLKNPGADHRLRHFIPTLAEDICS